MVRIEIQSEAFTLATLRSERMRVVALLCAVGVVLLVSSVRRLATDASGFSAVMAAVFAVFLVFEIQRLVAIHRAIRESRDLPRSSWVISTLIETLLPTGGLLVLTENPLLGPYVALTVPVALFYFVFIILSTLRLSWSLCLLTGVLSAVGYLAVVGYTVWRYPEGGEDLALPFAQFVTMYVVMILVCGSLAAGVTSRIRKHLLAALREAETRRQMERIEHDLNIARSIQQGLLPQRPPVVEGFDIAGWNEPADHTGGDYYDWQALPDGRIAISLADVAGHGIGPALVAADCRAYARASLPSGEQLGIQLDRINDLLTHDLSSSRFVTYVAVLLTPGIFEVELLSAGHGPLLIYRAVDDRVEALNPHDMPLGVDTGIRYGPTQNVDLAAGDLLVLVTDGFFEWRNPAGELFGTDRLGEAVRGAHSLPPGEIISRLHSAVVEFSDGTRQDDDLTAVVIKRGNAHDPSHQ